MNKFNAFSFLLVLHPVGAHFACGPFLEIPILWETSRSLEARRLVLVLFLSWKCKAIATQPALLVTIPFCLTEKQFNCSQLLSLQVPEFSIILLKHACRIWHQLYLAQVVWRAGGMMTPTCAVQSRGHSQGQAPPACQCTQIWCSFTVTVLSPRTTLLW